MMILDALILQIKLFLSEDMEISDIEVIETHDSTNLELDRLELRDYTSMIATGGKLNAMIVISYDMKLLNHLVEVFMDGEEVSDEEKQEIIDSVSGETINTIMGLALPQFPGRGKGVTITPPITVNDATNIKKYKNSRIISATIQTEYGCLSISALGSEDSIK
ncbi:MAG: chemotaxis protein CheX [Gammaproteobacteria bacterium]|nr:chemotaxis protein CheX [Gammaproteobacteria bacterium]